MGNLVNNNGELNSASTNRWRLMRKEGGEQISAKCTYSEGDKSMDGFSDEVDWWTGSCGEGDAWHRLAALMYVHYGLLIVANSPLRHLSWAVCARRWPTESQIAAAPNRDSVGQHPGKELRVWTPSYSVAVSHFRPVTGPSWPHHPQVAEEEQRWEKSLYVTGNFFFLTQFIIIWLLKFSGFGTIPPAFESFHLYFFFESHVSSCYLTYVTCISGASFTKPILPGPNSALGTFPWEYEDSGSKYFTSNLSNTP